MTVPGTHIIRQGGPRVAMALEVEGYDVRDCIHVVTSGGVEQWWLARWPVEGSVATNVLKHGVGALNIDGCRVCTSDNLNGGAYAGELREKTTAWQNADRSDGQGSGFRQGVGAFQQPSGRWPPNLVFLHAEGCKRVGEKLVKGITGGATTSDDALGILKVGRNLTKLRVKTYHHDADGKESVPEYACIEGCPVATLDELSGERKTTYVATHHQNNRSGGFLGQIGHPGIQGYNDTGGASRFFPCFESREELQAWFDRLIGNS